VNCFPFLGQPGDNGFHFEILSMSPVRQPYFSQAMENRVFSELDWLFGKIAVKIELIAK
jgi:hypothetical protein